MRKLTKDEWEKKYVVGPVSRFDQRYTMFNRANWDPEVKGLLSDWSFAGTPRDKPGFRLEEMALRMASDRASRIFGLMNTSKPNSNPNSHKIMAAIRGTNPVPATADKPRVNTGDTTRMSQIIKKAALHFGADVVGICRLDRRWVYSHTYRGQVQNPSMPKPPVNDAQDSLIQEIPEEYQYAVVMGFAMDSGLMQYYSSSISSAATGIGYARMDFTNALLAEYIRALGYTAIDCARNDVALSVPLAMQAGLGDLGRHGLLISPKFGSRLRLSKVITDLPLALDAPIDFGVTEFCMACEKCARTCPSHSILTGPRTDQPRGVSNVGNELKWPINPVSCRMHWSKAKRGGGCTICLSVCPYNKPDTWPHRAVVWFTDKVRWADPLYVRMDDMFGYGKPGRAEKFWEEWQPQ